MGKILKRLLPVKGSVLIQIHSYTYVHPICLYNYIKICRFSFSIICSFCRFISLVNVHVSFKFYTYLLPTSSQLLLSVLVLQKFLHFFLGFLCYMRSYLFMPFKQLCIILETTLQYKHCGKLTMQYKHIFQLFCNSGLSVTFHIITVDYGLKYYQLSGKIYVIQMYFITVIYGY